MSSCIRWEVVGPNPALWDRLLTHFLVGTHSLSSSVSSHQHFSLSSRVSWVVSRDVLYWARTTNMTELCDKWAVPSPWHGWAGGKSKDNAISLIPYFVANDTRLSTAIDTNFPTSCEDVSSDRPHRFLVVGTLSYANVSGCPHQGWPTSLVGLESNSLACQR
jgi:hypothetical protein